MFLKGMILEYDSIQGTGLLMMSNGKKKKFTQDDLSDTFTSPRLHQKVSCENDESPMNIKSLEEAIAVKPVAPEPKEEENLSSPKFLNVDECLNHFLKKGFNLIRDMEDGGVRTLVLRTYTTDEFGEVTIKSNGSTLDIKQTLNGKPV